MKTAQDLKEQGGGPWLGIARSWLQSHKRNGDRVTWGSLEELQPPMTVRDVEDLAAHVAAAAQNEEAKKYEGLLLAAKLAVEGLEKFSMNEAWHLRTAIEKVEGRAK